MSTWNDVVQFDVADVGLAESTPPDSASAG